MSPQVIEKARTSRSSRFSRSTTELSPGRFGGVGFEPTTSPSEVVCMLVPLGTGLSPGLSKHGFGPDGHISGLVPIDDIIAELVLTHVQVRSQSPANLRIT